MAQQDPTPGTARHPVTPQRGTTHAIEMLRADHRRIRSLFRQFERSQTVEGQAALAEKVCHALIVHMMIEEEIFYPAFLEATGDRQLHCEAEVGHEGIKGLIAQVSESPRHGERFVARMHLLAALVHHHVDEEERRDGMFAEAGSAGMDCEALGERLKEHRELLKRRMPLLHWRIPVERRTSGG